MAAKPLGSPALLTAAMTLMTLAGLALPAGSIAEEAGTSDVRLVTDSGRSLQVRYTGDATRAAYEAETAPRENRQLKWRAARPRQRDTGTAPLLPPPAKETRSARSAALIKTAGETEEIIAPEPSTLATEPRLRQPAQTPYPRYWIAQQPPLADPETTDAPPAVLEGTPSEIEEIPLVEAPLEKDQCAIERFHRIDEISINIAVHDPNQTPPTDCPIPGSGRFPDRDWQGTNFYWKASGLCHKPLYFEQVALERYGHSMAMPLEAMFTGAHFFATVPILPYKMGMDPPWECKYALGYYRPGSCAPFMLPGVPISVRGGLMQAGVMTGGVFLFP